MLIFGLRRIALSLLPLVLAPCVVAQSSAGYTVTHVAGADTKDASGNPLSAIRALPQTDGTSVAFLNGSGTTTCSTAYSLYSVPIGGGAPITISGPSITVDPTMPTGTTNSTCAHLASSGANLLFGTTYTSGTTHFGVWTVPLAGGSVSKVVATGDTQMMPASLAAPGTLGTVTSVNTNVGSFIPFPSGTHTSVNYVLQYKNQNSVTINADVNNNTVYGNLNVLSGNTCPGNGNTVTTTSDLYNEPVYSDGTIVANFLNGTSTNYLGATESMQLLETSPVPYYASCSLAVFAPDWGSLTGPSTFLLPGEPLPTTMTPQSTLKMNGLAVVNGNTYVSASQVVDGGLSTYSGIFETTPETMTQQTYYPANNTYTLATNPLPTKILSNYDSIPGITQGLATCPNGGISQAPSISGTFAANANYIVFEAQQTIQDCTYTTGTYTAGGLYALRLSDGSIHAIASFGKPAVAADPVLTSIGAAGPGSLSADNHLVFVAGYPDPTGTTVDETVYSVFLDQVASTLALAVPATATYGSALTLTATLTNNLAAGSSTPATGTVTFYDGSTSLGAGTLDSTGKATLSITSLSPGSHSFSASYTGDKNYQGATSATFSTTVAHAATTITLNASATTAATGSSVTLTAQVASAGGTPTGSVTFSYGMSSLGSASLSASGAATLTLTTLPAGTDVIQASYSGDANFAASQSTTLSVSIGTPDFSISANPTSASITAGQGATFVFTVTPSFGYNQTISFNCSGLPANTTCTFSPATLTPTGSAAVTSTLTVQTSGGTASLELPSAPFARAPKILLACLAMLPLALRRRRSRKHLTALLPIIIGLATSSLIGCSGPSQSSGPVTPKGTSTVSVTASAGTSGSSHAVSVTLTVN